MDKIVRRGLPHIKKGHQTVWHPAIFDSAYKYFQDRFRIVEKQIENKEIRLDLIVKTTPENVERVRSLTFPNLRNADNLLGNMAIASPVGSYNILLTNFLNQNNRYQSYSRIA